MNHDLGPKPSRLDQIEAALCLIVTAGLFFFGVGMAIKFVGGW